MRKTKLLVKNNFRIIAYLNGIWVFITVIIGYKINPPLFFNVFLPLRHGLGPAKEGEPQYVVVHCTGYIKSWPPAGKTNDSVMRDNI